MKRGLVGALRERDVALEVDPHGLARLKVTLGLEAQADHRHGLGAHHVLREAVLKLVGAPADRTNAAGIAEGEHALARYHGDAGVGAANTAVQRANRVEDGRLRQPPALARGAGELGGEHVEKNLGVARRVEVAAVRVVEFAAQVVRVRQVAVVRERNAERRVHVEGLAFVRRRRVALSRVADVANADAARQVAHVARTEDVTHEAEPLEEVKLKAVECRNAGGVLAAVLQEVKRVIDTLVDRRVGHQADNPAHDACFSFSPCRTNEGSAAGCD